MRQTSKEVLSAEITLNRSMNDHQVQVEGRGERVKDAASVEMGLEPVRLSSSTLAAETLATALLELVSWPFASKLLQKYLLALWSQRLRERHTYPA